VAVSSIARNELSRSLSALNEKRQSCVGRDPPSAAVRLININERLLALRCGLRDALELLSQHNGRVVENLFASYIGVDAQGFKWNLKTGEDVLQRLIDLSSKVGIHVPDLIGINRFLTVDCGLKVAAVSS
jgi:hypothetical protein